MDLRATTPHRHLQQSALGRRRARHSGQGGWSIFETMIAIGVIATGLMVVVQQLSISFRESHHNQNRAFAFQKAAAILGEIHNSIGLGRITTSDELYALADGEPNPVLTTRVDAEGLPFAPQHAMSGNVIRRDHWAWARRIMVAPHETTGLYYCRVQLLRWDDDDQWRDEATHAQLFSLLPSTEAPEQVHDVWVIACAEAASTWGPIAELRTHMESAATEIASQSQVRLRLHWITRLGFGRDNCYIPFVNTARSATAAAPWSYWLPGVLGNPTTSAVLYDSDLIEGTHRTELGLRHAMSARETIPTAVADQNNHCLRTPAAWQLFEARVAAGLDSVDEPPLQLLLDDMEHRPERYRNAMFVNLHGAALPMPPLRNYSDAAKDPVRRPGVRAVTHPTRLWTPRDPDGNGSHGDTNDVDLRVHAYRTTGSGDVLPEPILVQIFGVDLTGAINAASASTLNVHRLQGGVDVTTGTASGDTRDYTGFDEAGGKAPQTATSPYEMWFEAGFTSGSPSYTWLRLHNTPLVAPEVGTRGLSAAARLYGLDYIPAPPNGTFDQDLATDSALPIPRNTARWRIRIPKQVFVASLLPNTDQVVRVVTRIGASTTTGQRWPAAVEPLNYSETWTWWARSATAVPATERAQFLGDPRHLPYADLMAGGATQAHGYNWHFDDLKAPSFDAQPQWPCFDAARLTSGFAGASSADATRYYQILRRSLQACGAILVAPDALAHEVLLGGEIAVHGPAGAAAIDVHPLYTGGEATAVDTITPSTTTGTMALVRGATPTWWAKPWLGELFPDDLAASWYSSGNLGLDGTTGLRWRQLASSPLPDLPAGTEFSTPRGAAVGPAGATAFVNSGTSVSTFAVASIASTLARAIGGAPPINRATNMVEPANVAVSRMFATNSPAPSPLPSFAFVDTLPRNTVSVGEDLWATTTGGRVAAILPWRETGTAFLVPATIRPIETKIQEVTAQLLLAGLRTFHTAGLPAMVGRTTQLPRLQVTDPAPGASKLDPDLVTVRWQTQWLRFDGQAYTEAYPPGFSENEGDLVYRVMWSGDNGTTWTSALTDQPTQPGVWPNSIERLADAGSGTESFTFTFPEAAPAGEYLVMVEAWRLSTRCHSASHRVHMFVRRSS